MSQTNQKHYTHEYTYGSITVDKHINDDIGLHTVCG